MNDLSWLLLIADIVGNMRTVLATFLIGGAIMAAICWVYGAASYDLSFREDEKKQAKAVMSFPKRLLWPLIICAAVFLVTPHKTTIYLVAASEMGEEAIRSELGQKVFQYLEQELDDRLGEQSQ